MNIRSRHFNFGDSRRFVRPFGSTIWVPRRCESWWRKSWKQIKCRWLGIAKQRWCYFKRIRKVADILLQRTHLSRTLGWWNITSSIHPSTVLRLHNASYVSWRKFVCMGTQAFVLRGEHESCRSQIAPMNLDLNSKIKPRIILGSRLIQKTY